MLPVQRGYFGIDSGKGCSECACDRIGSTSSQCNQLSGQCQCRLGVGGRACNRCQPGYYGFSSEGCTGKSLNYNLGVEVGV